MRACFPCGHPVLGLVGLARSPSALGGIFPDLRFASGKDQFDSKGSTITTQLRAEYDCTARRWNEDVLIYAVFVHLPGLVQLI